MATYEEIYGKRVKEFDSDPTLESSYEGQVWYDKSSGVLKSVLSVGAWSSATDALYPSYNTTGFGAQTGSVFVGGSYPGYVNLTQEYNGSGFSTGGNYPESRGSIGTAGVLTAGLAWGGNSAPEVESQLTNEYNGTSWTNVNNYPITVAAPAGAGTQTAGLGAGGWDYSGPFTAKNTTNEYDGTNWTGGGNLNTARSSFWGGGTQTAAIMAGGDTFSPGTVSDYSAATEEYNGTSWTSVNSLPGTSSGIGGRTTNAVQTDFRIFSSSHGTAFTSPYVKNYEYDGTNWAAGPNFTTARYGAAGSGTGPAAVMTGGRTPSYVLTTEEFNKSINTITAAAWASATAMNTGRGRFGASGGKDSALAAGGYTVPSNTSNTEKYDGTSWTESGNLPVAKNSFPLIGSQTASIACGGYTPPTYTNASDTFDGSSWASAPTMGTGRESAAGSTASPYNAVVVYGGYAAAAPNIAGLTEEFDGSSWSEQNNMPTALSKMGGGGTQTAAISSGGDPPASNLTQFYDGTNWTTGPATLVSAQQWHGYAGTQTANFIFGGSTSPDSNSSGVSQAYDGTSWSTRPSLGTPRYAVGGSGQGTPTSASAFGGLISPIGPGAKNFTEEFTGQTETVTFKTLTTS